MKTVAHKLALAALCATALTGLGQSAQAASFDISGGGSLLSLSPSEFPGYGTAVNQDNVVNSGTSGADLFDTSATLGSTWISSITGSAAMLDVVGLSASQTYSVKWTYLGSESADTNVFSASGIAGYAENNANANACTGSPCPSPQIGAQTIGVGTPGLTASLVNFTLTDSNSGASVTNGSGNAIPGSGVSNLIFSYAYHDLASNTYQLTSTVTDYVVFGFNDNGGRDDNHDDFVGVAQLLVQGQGTQGDTPIPASLPLFGSVLGGGYLFGRARKRRQAAAKAAAV